MGTLGHTSFENDTALDCADELIACKSPAKYTKRMADQINRFPNESHDADDCNRVIAVAEMCAIIRGHAPKSVPDEIRQWASETSFRPSASIVVSLAKACEAVLVESELKALWDNDTGWRRAVKRTIGRLSRPQKKRDKSAFKPTQVTSKTVIRPANKGAATDAPPSQLSVAEILRRLKKMGCHCDRESKGSPIHVHVPEDNNTQEMIDLISCLDSTSSLTLSYGKKQHLLDTAGLGRLTNLTELEAERSEISDRQFEFVSELKNLRRVSLSHLPRRQKGRGITVKTLQYFANCVKCESLDLSFSGVKDDWLKPLEGWKSLDSISLHDTHVNGSGLNYLVNCKNLSQISLSHARLNNDGLDAIARFQKLSRLALQRNNLNQLDLSPLVELKNLGVLQLANTKLTDETFARILANAKWNKLKHLDVSKTKIGDRSIAELARFKSLETLDLDRTKVSGVGFSELKCPKLFNLSLNGTNVDNDVVDSIRHLKSLRCLFLNSCRIDDRAIEKLASLEKLSHLGVASSKVTLSGLEALLGHPNLYMLTVNLNVYTKSLELRFRKRCKRFGLLNPM